VLLQVTNSLPKIKTKKHYKYHKNQNDVFDVFYNKDLAIIEKSKNNIFAYENIIVLCSRDYIINKVIRDFVLVYRIKPHNINKDHTIQNKIGFIIDGLKSLIKENDKKYNSFAYTQKPFTVCFVQLDSYRLTRSFIRYYELSPETMKWVSTGINKLDPGCDDCEKAMNDCEGIRYADVILNKYYKVDCYKYAEDDEYYEEYYMKYVARDKENDHVTKRMMKTTKVMKKTTIHQKITSHLYTIYLQVRWCINLNRIQEKVMLTTHPIHIY